MAFSFNEVKVGFLVILSIAFLFILTVMIGNFQSYLTDNIEIRILLPSVVGLDKYAPVTYSGVRIGTIVDLQYNDSVESPVVVAEIEYDSPVSTNSEVQLVSAGMLSPLFIEISGGTDEKRLSRLLSQGEIQEGEIYLNAKPYTSMNDVFALAGDVKSVLVKVEALLDDLQEPIQKSGGLIESVSADLNVFMNDLKDISREGKPLIHETLTNINGMVIDASQSIKPVLQDIQTAVQSIPPMINDTQRQLNQFLSSANGMIDSVSPQISNTFSELQNTIVELRERVANVEQNLVSVLNDADALLQENREDIDQMIDRLGRITENLDSFSAQLAKDPWRIFWKTEGRREPPKVSPEWDPFEIEP